MALRLDYSNMMISPGGIDEKMWASAGAKFDAAKRGFDKLRSSGAVGFAELGGDKELLAQVEKFAATARGKYDDVVVLGIGGSALGPIALRTALRPRPMACGSTSRGRRGGSWASTSRWATTRSCWTQRTRRSS
jgi:glucose-6-phosphate isomerase